MPALVVTEYYCEITWLGAVMHRPRLEIETDVRAELDLTWDGVAGAAHSGRTRPSDSRVTLQHQRGTEIANVRQVSLISAEEMAEVAADMGIEAIDPAWLGANIVVQGLPDFSHLPPSSRLQAENGTTLIVDMQNYPCTQVSKTIAETHPKEGKLFKPSAKAKRGVTAWIERPGLLRLGDRMRLHCPEQRAWRPGV